SWGGFFWPHPRGGASGKNASAADGIVPSPLMPPLMFEWVIEGARERWPDRDVATGVLGRAPETPWQRATPDGPHYVSFAVWTCPINCIDQQTCPQPRKLRK